MPNPLIHRILVPTGCLLWAFSFLLETQLLYPYAPIGLLVAPILTIAGVVYWAKYYRAVNGKYPGFANLRKNVVGPTRSLTLFTSYLFSHLQEFWTFAVLVWMGLVLIGYLTFSRSDAFAAAKAYCEQDTVIQQRTGGIQSYSPIVSGTMSSAKAELFFGIRGREGSFFGKALLSKQNEKWQVTGVTFR